MTTPIKRRLLPLAGTAGLAVYLLLGGWGDGTEIGARELPIPAAIGELVSYPERYDESRVFVTGKVRSIHVERGRMGSTFFAMVLEEAPPDGTEVPPGGANGSSVQVFSLTASKFDNGSQVSVQGTYHRNGFYGGWPYHGFIAAESIVGDQPDSGSPDKGSGM
jgi:hypothetical protein